MKKWQRCVWRVLNSKTATQSTYSHVVLKVIAGCKQRTLSQLKWVVILSALIAVMSKGNKMITLKQIITNSGLSTRQWAIKNGEHDNQVRRWLSADAVYINGVRYLRDSRQSKED